MSQPKKSASPKVTIISTKGANQVINYLLEDRDRLEWLVELGGEKRVTFSSTILAATSFRISARSSISKREFYATILARSTISHRIPAPPGITPDANRKLLA